MREDERKNDKQNAFMESYDSYHNDIFRFALIKTKNRNLALDITQNTFMKFWEYLQSEKAIQSERALLYRIARNAIIDHYRKREATLIESYIPHEREHFSEEVYQRYEDMLDGEKIISLLHKLPESTREIVSLKYIHGLTISEISKIVKKEKKTVSVYLHRGVKQLRKIVDSYYER